MKMAMLGLGRMGMNMARRLLAGGHEVVAWNRSPDKARALAREAGAVAAAGIDEVVAALAPPRILWLMLPAGAPTEAVLAAAAQRLEAGDIIIDGGNTDFKDDLRRAQELAELGIHYLDAGVSGGVHGLAHGYCLMVGGPRAAYDTIAPLLAALAPEDGCLYCGPAGAGHFVKMVHNGIEYGMMQAYAEGFAILEASSYGAELDYAALSRVWNHGSVIRSWLLELMENAFGNDPKLTALAGRVDDSGEGRWSVRQAVESGVSAPVITAALFRRFESRQDNAFENRVLAAMRREFGGHAVTPAQERGK